MNWRKVKFVSFNFVILLIPTFVGWIGQTNYIITKISKYLDSILKTTIDINLLKDICLATGLIGYIIYAVKLYKLNEKNLKHERQVVFALDYIKRVLFAVVKDCNFQDMNLRVFRVKKKLTIEKFDWKNLELKVNIKKVLKLYIINGFTDNNIPENLTFDAEPDWQGLVGMCYNERQPIMLFDVDRYQQRLQLSDYQKSKTRYVKFCIAVPLLDEENSVYAIVSFDSNNRIAIDDREKDKLYVAFNEFAVNFVQDFPHLV